MHYMYGYLRSELSRNMVKGMYSTLDELARLRLLAEMIIASCPDAPRGVFGRHRIDTLDGVWAR